MKQKVSTNQIFNSTGALNSLLEKELPIPVAFSLSRTLNKIQSELVSINDMRRKILTKYAEPDATGSINVGPTHPNFNDVVVDLNQLMSQEIEIDLEPISVDLLQTVNIPLRDMLLIDFLFREPTEEKTEG